MRWTIFFAICMLMVSTHAFKRPSSWGEFKKDAHQRMEEAKTHLAALKKHLPLSLQHKLQQAMEKLEQHKAKKDVHHAMEAMLRGLMSSMRNLGATRGLHVNDRRALEALVKHMMLAQARHNMERSTVMETYGHHLATHFLGEKSPANDIKALGGAFSTLGHNYMRKFTEGVEKILHKHSVNMNMYQLHQALHNSCVEAMKGKDIMEALMAEMNKMGVNTAGLDPAVKNELKAHFEKLKTEGTAELEKLIVAHKIPKSMEQVVAAMKMKGKEMMEKMKAIQKSAPKTMMHKLEMMAKRAFKNMKPGDHQKLMMKLRLMIRPAMNTHFHMIAKIFKNHKMGSNHVVIHYTIYRKMKEEIDHDDYDRHHHHHHGWWHKKPVRLACMIGGSIFGIAVLVALIIVTVHMVKEKRRTPRMRETGGEKSTLPYSIMDEKSSTKA